MLDENAAFRVRRKAGVVWAFRARAELDAHAQFARLADTLANAGAANEIVDMATSASADEARHAVLCERLVQHFGATLIEGTPPPTNPSALRFDGDLLRYGDAQRRRPRRAP